MSEVEKRDEKFSREKFLGLLRAGLWPSTALAYMNIGKNEWREMRQADASLAAEVTQAVAAFEMIHVRNLHAKIQEANDWRGSAWWLAQRFPSRYGTGRENKQVEKAVEEVLAVLDEALSSEFTSPTEVRRVATALARVRLKRST